MDAAPVTACLAFRNTSEYLREWLLFHLASGVEHFWLYDNDSTDDHGPVVRPFVERGVVEVIGWPGYFQQTAIYDDCFARARERLGGGAGSPSSMMTSSSSTNAG